MLRPRRIVPLVAVVALLSNLGVTAGARPRHSRGPGCDRSRPAVAHFAGGKRLRHQPSIRPMPCMTFVGRAVESATIGVTRSGAVLFAPRDDNTAAPPQNTLKGPEFGVRSRDQGRTWAALGSGGPTTGGLVPPWMSVDPQTSRIWFLTTLPSLCGARISWSDDDGNQWHTNPKVGCPGQGGEKILEGPPPAHGARPHGYPHVVYYCANGGLDVGPTTLACYRSLDGGRTFTAIRGVPDPPGRAGKCGIDHVARPGIVAPDGNVYMSLDLCGNLGIAISHDEGATWQRRRIARTQVRDVYTTSIASDRAGNVYVAWLAAARGIAAGPNASSPSPARGLPFLVISRDHGRTWSKPMMIAAPGVRQAFNIAIAATGRGHIAVSYLGSRSAAVGASFSGYITESFGALARRPMFLSAAVNPPARPLYPGLHHEAFGDRLFYIGDAFGPDGTPWAAFHCVDERACPTARLGVAARLAMSSR